MSLISLTSREIPTENQPYFNRDTCSKEKSQNYKIVTPILCFIIKIMCREMSKIVMPTLYFSLAKLCEKNCQK